MATTSGESIIARARVIASQTGMDANSSPVIDSKGGLRALLNNSIRHLYRLKSDDQKFIRDTVTRQTVTMTAGIGACPPEIMREFLHQAQFQDDNGSLITYWNYNIDQDSGQNFRQLGYVVMQGDNFNYTAPAPTTSYSGNLFVTVPSFPTFPADLADPITFPSTATVDDVVITLAEAIMGKVDFQNV